MIPPRGYWGRSPRKDAARVYLAVSAVLWLGGLVYIWRRSPGLITERLRPGPGALESATQEQVLYLLPGGVHYLVALVDRSRPIPSALRRVGLLGYVASNLLVIWAMAENRFFSSAVRLQPERGQFVISSGPYRWVRHPGYLAGIGLFVFSGLALGSWWSLAPAAAWSWIIVRRAHLEDRFLLAQLPGYTAYARRVPWRLLPGVW
jgi:protein-S-isoprenylcysteine O-methyltransferase Ste14